MIREFDFASIPGVGMLVLVSSVLALSLYGLIHFAKSPDRTVAIVLALVVVLLLDIVAMAGFFTVAPNQSVVLTLFGQYKGSVRKNGLHWVNPFMAKQKVSLRVHNFETAHLKVNDYDGNPIEIGAVVVWKVFDAAEAVFEVENYTDYVKVQCEAALRNLATAFPYDAHEDGQMSLRGNASEVVSQLKKEIEERLEKAGVEVIESRISHLAYAPEIATAMLQRQQASAIVAARQKIVEGAVGMVEMALAMLAEKGIVDLDAERKAAMVSNLLVVLCGERATQPVVNTGTIYH
ncbi:MAG: SPFH domain-containing protein [Bryobacter sp.]|nr:SPFH domain-containing protein [Bryobacter sp.]